MFERFTEKAIKVIMLAQEEARRLGHGFVGTEMILLGLISEGTSIAAKTLKSVGVNLKDARVEVERIIGRGSGFVPVSIPFTPRGKRILDLAWDEARQLNNNYIGTEHLLLGLVKDGEGVAAKVLGALNVELPEVRKRAIELLGESAAAKPENMRSEETEEDKIRQLQKAQLSVVKISKELAIMRQEFEEAAALRCKQSEIERQIHMGAIKDKHQRKFEIGLSEDIISEIVDSWFKKMEDGTASREDLKNSLFNIFKVTPAAGEIRENLRSALYYAVDSVLGDGFS